jgi:MFS family permease
MTAVGRRDELATTVSTVAFSMALSLSAVALPLLAVAAGYQLVAVGVLTALSAVAQLGTRLVIGRLMRRYADWVLVVLAALFMAASTVIVAVSTDVLPFAVCQLAQGAARGAFWTGSQTHAVRGKGPAATALARMNVASGWGQLFGPIAAGFLADRSLTVALLVSTGFAVAAASAGLVIDRYPPFATVLDRSARQMWRRPGVDTGCRSGVTTGAWRGLLGSYVPVVLASVNPATTVGVLISIANAASLAGAAWMTRLGGPAMRRTFLPATLLCGVTSSLIAVMASHVMVAGLLLAISGAAVGLLQVVGPAIAVDAVLPEERGDVIATTGTFRAVALLGTPALVAGLLGVVALVPAMAAVGLLMAVPAAAGRATGGR